MKTQARLASIENNREINMETDFKFLYAYQRTLLLALKETGTLTEMQYRHAEKELRTQFLTYVKNKNMSDSRNGEDRNYD